VYDNLFPWQYLLEKNCLTRLPFHHNFVSQVLTSKYKAIPKKITVGKRLAQCMHPALPGGVHLKALQVYETIFNIIKKKRLQTDLYIYR